MHTKLVCLLFLVGLAVAALPVQAQSPNALQNPRATVVVPASTIQRLADIGIRAHTNHLILVRPTRGKPNRPTGPQGLSPATIYSVYLPSASTSSGGGGTIAIVDAYDYPTAENDLNVFSSQFGLPACTTANGCFKVVYAGGSTPRANCGWGQEAALDIEWAHAMAPEAKIVLVEAASSRFTDLFDAVDVATQQVTAGGGKGEVSMSWGGSEFSSETSYDGHFQHNNVVYFGASGDTGGVIIYPSASPYVVAAGGTTLNLKSNGDFISETGWSGSGGGPSKYEEQLDYQFGVSGASSTQRSVPDLSFDADPYTGVSVYDSTKCQGMSGWLIFGGTSVSSPALAGIVNRAMSFEPSSVDELTTMYGNRTNTKDFYDVTSGSAGSYTAAPGWDYVTGIGSSRGTNGK